MNKKLIICFLIVISLISLQLSFTNNDVNLKFLEKILN